jgi:glycosyltransferase involved in cell wall biosynthesis
MIEKLRILNPEKFLPGKFGGCIRTYHTAKLLRDLFKEIEILAVDEEYFFDGILDGLRITQEQKYQRFYERYVQYSKALFSKKFSPRVPAKSFLNKIDYLYQLESPFLYNLIKKERIKNFVLNEHNVDWMLAKLPYIDLKQRIYKRIFSERDKKIEIDALTRASLILTCSENDKKIILKEVPNISSNIFMLPNCVNFEKYASYLNSTNNIDSSREYFTITFVGTLSYPPNFDAIKIIISKIAPQFGSDTQFLIVGKNPPDLRKPDNVHFLGYIEDIKQIIQQSDICIAPLRFGSGTRLKILEYMAMKKAVISTSIGAEGLDARNGEQIILEDNLDLFGEKIKSLLQNEREMRILGENAQKIVKEKYDWQLYKKPLEYQYKKLL